jgi:lipid-A-disaccharide synthase-like uncharacterized protein
VICRGRWRSCSRSERSGRSALRKAEHFGLLVAVWVNYSAANMDWLTNLLWHDGKLFGIKWNTWEAIGWLANAIFFSRFVVQWYATEKLKRVVVPAAFWWLSLAGSLLLLGYAWLYKHEPVFIFAYAFTWIPYTRNLLIHRRHAEAHLNCTNCGQVCPPHSHFCFSCGTALAGVPEKAVG